MNTNITVLLTKYWLSYLRIELKHVRRWNIAQDWRERHLFEKLQGICSYQIMCIFQLNVKESNIQSTTCIFLHQLLYFLYNACEFPAFVDIDWHWLWHFQIIDWGDDPSLKWQISYGPCLTEHGKIVISDI